MFGGRSRKGEGTVSCGRRNGQSGASLLEGLVAFVLIALLVPGIWATLARQIAAGTRMVSRAEALEGIRVVSWLIPRELELGSEGRDWTASSDTVALRAFRGFAVSDSVGASPGDHWVCFSGDRAPDPRKDSVLVLWPSGAWTQADLLRHRRTAGTCSGPGPSGVVAQWSVAGISEEALAFRLFERGSYHLEDEALRYRRGEGGRQPVTSEFMERGRFVPGPGGGPGLEWRLSLLPVPSPHQPAGPPPPSIQWRGPGG